MLRRFLIVIPGACLLLAMFGCDGGDADANPWVAKINGQAVTLAELDEEFRSASGDFFANQAETPEIKAAKRGVLADLVDRKLLMIEAKRRNVSVNPQELDEQLERLLGTYDPQKLSEMAEQAGFSLDAFKERARELLTVEKLFKKEIFPRILTKDEEIEAAYQEQKDKYKRPEMVRLHQIVTASEQDAQTALDRISKGESFEKVAKDMSIMPEASRGGDLGWVTRTKLPDPFRQIVFDLPRGTTNKPIKSDYGYHIFQVIEHSGESTLPLSVVRGKVQEDLFADKKVKAEKDILDTLHRRNRVEYHPLYAPVDRGETP